MTPPTPPGRLIDVGGYRLHLNCQGEGRPAALLDSGLAGNSLVWANTLAALAPITRACAFDRAGYAWSEAAPPGPARTSHQLVAELRTLLTRAGLHPPYVLLGHSAGAIHMLVYAHTYPDEVTGLVLVDPSHPDMFERAPGVPSGQVVARSFRAIAGLGRLGLLRWLGPLLLGQLSPNLARSFAPETWQALLYWSRQAKDYQTAAREASAADESFRAARGTPGCLGDRPLVVLSADWWVTGKMTRLKQAMRLLRDDLAAYSTRGRHEIVSGCDHANLPVVRPDAVADAVKWVIAQGSAEVVTR